MSLLTGGDLTRYRPRWYSALQANLSDGHLLHTAPVPAGGATVAYILNVMDALRIRDKSEKFQFDLRRLHYLVEAFKFALNKRVYLGDERFVDVREVSDLQKYRGHRFTLEHVTCSSRAG